MYATTVWKIKGHFNKTQTVRLVIIYIENNELFKNSNIKGLNTLHTSILIFDWKI